MNIYLVQHGEAIPKEEDRSRPLSKKGQEDIKKTAAFLEDIGIRIGKIIHSGKTRARQTAAIMAIHLNPDTEPSVKKGLSPMDDVRDIFDEIVGAEQDCMIVGHLPHLAKLSSLMTTGNEFNPVVRFQEGGVVCLHYSEEDDAWSIGWMIVPDIISG